MLAFLIIALAASPIFGAIVEFQEYCRVYRHTENEKFGNHKYQRAARNAREWNTNGNSADQIYHDLVEANDYRCAEIFLLSHEAPQLARSLLLYQSAVEKNLRMFMSITLSQHFSRMVPDEVLVTAMRGNSFDIARYALSRAEDPNVTVDDLVRMNPKLVALMIREERRLNLAAIRRIMDESAPDQRARYAEAIILRHAIDVTNTLSKVDRSLFQAAVKDDFERLLEYIMKPEELHRKLWAIRWGLVSVSR